MPQPPPPPSASLLAASAPGLGAAPAPDSLRGLAVLVVDDSIDAVESFSLLLQLSGARVTSACGGAEALRMLEGGLPDVLVCDLGMPGIDGYAVARALRAAPGGAAPVAIALSGLTGWQEAADARAAGFDAMVSKPALVEHVEREVLEVLRRRGSAAGSLPP